MSAPMSYEQERERQDALDQDAMTQGEYMSAALGQYAAAHGEHAPQRAWISTPFDTWERNPHYQGPPVRHPEDDQDESDDAPFYDEGERPGARIVTPAGLPIDWRTDLDDEIPF